MVIWLFGLPKMALFESRGYLGNMRLLPKLFSSKSKERTYTKTKYAYTTCYLMFNETCLKKKIVYIYMCVCVCNTNGRKLSVQLLCYNQFISTSYMLPLQIAYKFWGEIREYCYIHVHIKRGGNKQGNRDKWINKDKKSR